MDKKLMVYPFNKKVSAVARYARLLKGYILTAVVSPKSYGYEGKDASCMDGEDLSGIIITSSFQKGLELCDSILFSTSTFFMDLDYYEKRIKEAISYGIEVLITKELSKVFDFNQRSIPMGAIVLGNNPTEKKLSYDKINYTREISVPVITSLQLGEFCHGLDSQLLMAERFEKEGYRVSQVSSDNLGELFGIHTVPDYIYEQHISYEDKIINFNHFVSAIIEEEESDILLLGVSEAILPYSDRINNHFGVIPSIITKAVQADLGILNLYYGTYDKEALNHLISFCRYALNTDIDYISIANTTMMIKEMDSINPIHYLTMDYNLVIHSIDSDYSEHDCMFFHSHISSSMDSVYRHIINRLLQNKEVVRI